MSSLPLNPQTNQEEQEPVQNALPAETTQIQIMHRSEWTFNILFIRLYRLIQTLKRALILIAQEPFKGRSFIVTVTAICLIIVVIIYLVGMQDFDSKKNEEELVS